jgi:hypothetical protein
MKFDLTETGLTSFRKELRDCLLDVVWRQWTSLGVSGHGESWSDSVIDPEALLASSLRRMLKRHVISQLERSRLAFTFGDDSSYPGEALTPYFVAQMKNVLELMHRI